MLSQARLLRVLGNPYNSEATLKVKSALGCLILLILAGPASAGAGRAAPYFAFHNNFWINLHQTLFHEASLRKLPPEKRARFDPSSLPDAPLSSGDRDVWNTAVLYYADKFAGRSQVFDDQLIDVSAALMASPDPADSPLASVGLSKEHVQVLNDAAAVYRKYWWPAHQKSNEQWIAAIEPKVSEMQDKIIPQLERGFRSSWPASPLRIDVAFWVDAIGYAYTTDHTTISSRTDSQDSMDAVELVFHEGAHVIVHELQRALSKGCEEQKKDCGDLWHAVQFYTLGELMKGELRKQNIDYTPYPLKYRVYQSARWTKYLMLIEKDWKPYLEGKQSFDEAVKSLVSDL
jgi:hypothetical protein